MIVTVAALGGTTPLAVTKIVAVVTRVSMTVTTASDETAEETDAAGADTSDEEEASAVTVTVTVSWLYAVQSSELTEDALMLEDPARLESRLDEGATVWMVMVVPCVTVVVV